MKDILIQYAVDIAASLVVVLIGIIGAWLSKILAKRMELKNINAAKSEVISAAEQTVLDLKQTMVDDLKAAAEDGKLSKEEVAALGVKLLSITTSKLSASTIKLLEPAQPQLDRAARLQGHKTEQPRDTAELHLVHALARQHGDECPWPRRPAEPSTGFFE